MEEQILKLMQTLDITREEAFELMAEDAEIDRGADPHPLTAEQEKASKQARQTTATNKNTKRTREKKADDDKQFLMDSLLWCLTTNRHTNDGDLVEAEILEVINPEREATFLYNGKKYKITLSCPRS